jgi:hypothetical protein
MADFELLAKTIAEQAPPARTLANLRTVAPRATAGEGGTDAPNEMPGDMLNEQFDYLAKAAGTMIVYEARPTGGEFKRYAGVILPFDSLQDSEKMAMTAEDRNEAQRSGYVVKLSARTNHIALVEQQAVPQCFPMPKSGWDYRRIVHATVHQAELRRALIVETANLYKAYQAKGGRAPAAAAAAGAASDGFLWFKPSTWHPEDDLAEKLVFIKMECSVSAFSDAAVKRSVRLLELWVASTTSAGTPFTGTEHGALGDLLVEQLRFHAAVEKGCPVGPLADTMRKQDFAEDPMGAAIDKHQWRGRSPLRRGGSTTRRRTTSPTANQCFACGVVGHFAPDCPDAEKKKVYEAARALKAKNWSRGGRR